MCNPINPCNNCYQCCQEPIQCPPTPCTTGCLTDTATDCVNTSKDLDLCGTTIAKGTTLTSVLEQFLSAQCDGIEVRSTDIHTKIDANDTTSGYLFDKITVCDNLTKTVTNINGNETLRLCSKIDTVTAGNILTSGVNGLYVPTPAVSGSTTVQTTDSTHINFTTTPIVNGYDITGVIKISSELDNLLTTGVSGLYVPMPPALAPLSVAAIDTTSIDTTVSLVGNTYNVSSQLKIDPASTVPYSFTAQGLKLDCCPTGNTLLTKTDSTSITTTLTPIVGGYNISSAAIVAPIAGNALSALPNGLYVAPSSGAALTVNDTFSTDLTLGVGNVLKSDLKVQDSNTVDLEIPNNSGLIAHVKITSDSGNILGYGTDGKLKVPTSAVSYSADACNIAQLGSDGGIYAPHVESPNALRLYDNGTDIIFEFSGPSSSPIDYEVEYRGTTGSPLTWINGDATFITQTGGVLSYNVISNIAVVNTVVVRVRSLCGSNVSDWTSLTFVPEHTYVSESGSITIIPATSGIAGQYSFDITEPTCTNDFTCTPSIININGVYFAKVVRVANSINSDVYTLRVHSPSLGDTLGGITVSDELVSMIPLISYTSGETYQIIAEKHCTYTNTNSASVTINITTLPGSCIYDTWANVPTLDLQSGIVLLQTYTPATVTNDYRLKYRLNQDNSVILNGVIKVNLGGSVAIGADTGWKNLIDLSNIMACSTLGSAKEFYHTPEVNADFDYITDTFGTGSILFTGGVYIRRSGNMIQFRCPDTTSTASGYIVFNGFTFN